MPGLGGKQFEQWYNAQAAVDSARQVIVAAEVRQQPSDKGLAVPLMEQVQANTGGLLDRLTHHCHIMEFNGDSYRFKESLREKEAATPSRGG